MDKTDSLKSPLITGSQLFLIVVLVAITSLLYSQTIHYPLVFDDISQLVPERIFKDYGEDFTFFQVRWVSYGSFALTYKLVGENWAIYRITNIALHGATGAAVFWFSSRLFRVVLGDVAQNKKYLDPMWLAFFGALIFVVHPISVYAVSYLLQRSIVMATLFGVLSLISFQEGLVQEKNRWYLAAIGFYILAVFSKEHAVLIPMVAVAMTLLVRKPSLNQLKAFWWLLPIALIILGALGFFYSDILGKAFDPTSLRFLDELSQKNPDIKKYAYPLSIMNEGYLYFKYLFLWFVPYPGWMSIDIREFFPTRFLSWPETLGFVAFITYPLIGARLLLKGGRQGLFGFGMLFPWMLFATEFSTVWVQDPFVLYRSYLWMAGLPALLPLLFGRVSAKLSVAILTSFALLSAGIAMNRLETFKTELAAWDDAVKKNEDGRPRLGIDRLYTGRGEAYIKHGQPDQAFRDYDKAVELNPRSSDYRLNRGTANYQLRRYTEALLDYTQAIQLDRWNLKAYFNRAATYVQLGQDDLAISDFSSLIKTDVHNTWADVYVQRGALYQKQGKYKEALQDLNNAINAERDNYAAYLKRGNIHFYLNQVMEGFNDFDKALSLAPQSLDANFSRGFANVKLGRFQDALGDLNNAIAIDPSHVNSHLLRSEIYIRQNQIDKALNEYDIILKLNPNDGRVYLNRGEVFLALKNFTAAKQDLEKSCQLGIRVGCDKLKLAAK